MKKTTFYKKEGKKYIPVLEYDPELLDSLGYGDHLVSIYAGGRSTIYNIDPAFGPMIAAGRYAEKGICDAMIEASQARPKNNPTTPEQLLAWDMLKKSYKDELFFISWPSVIDIAKSGVKAMAKEADELLEIPAVRHAYEHFMLVAKLSMKEKQRG